MHTRKSVVLILNHFKDRHLFDLYTEMEQSCRGERDVVLLSDRTRKSLSFARTPRAAREFEFRLDELLEMGYPGKQDIALQAKEKRNLKLGNADLPVLLFFAAHAHYEHYWIVEYDVRFTGPWRDFFAAFDHSDAGLLGTSLIRHAEHPQWSHWDSLRIPGVELGNEEKLRGFFPVYRISSTALTYLDTLYRQGYAGHMEGLIPTVLQRGGFSIEDIGGDGAFVGPDNINRFYENCRTTNELSPGTFVYRPVRAAAGAESNRLWHPVKAETSMPMRIANRLFRELR